MAVRAVFEYLLAYWLPVNQFAMKDSVGMIESVGTSKIIVICERPVKDSVLPTCWHL